MTFQCGILVFPDVQQLDLTGPYEVFASLPETAVHLLWKERSAIVSSTGHTQHVQGRALVQAHCCRQRKPG